AGGWTCRSRRAPSPPLARRPAPPGPRPAAPGRRPPASGSAWSVPPRGSAAAGSPGPALPPRHWLLASDAPLLGSTRLDSLARPTALPGDHPVARLQAGDDLRPVAVA